MSGGGDDDVVAELLEGRHRLAADLAVGDQAGEVVGGLGHPILGQLGEVAEELHDHRPHLLGCTGPPLQVGIGRPEQLLGQRQHAAVVGLGQTEDRQDHLQWIRHGDLAA